MNYQEGDIFDKTNIQFKETLKNDLRLHGHPMLLPIEVGFMDDYYYFFSISSQVHYYTLDPNRYFPIPKGNGTGLTKPSLVDLKHVYKYRKQSHNVRGNLSSAQVKQLMDKFKKYSEKNADIDCNELLGTLV